MEPKAETIALAIIERMTAMSAERDRTLANCRQVVRRSANAIRAAHRGAMAAAQIELDAAHDLVGGLIALRDLHAEIYWAGYVQDATKEYAEARILLAILRDSFLPTPSDVAVEDAAYLNGLAEAGSELRRDILDLLRSDDVSRAEELLALMDEIYAVLVTIDFPDAVTGGLRRTTDAFRAVIERTRGDVTLTLNQRRLERALIAQTNR